MLCLLYCPALISILESPLSWLCRPLSAKWCLYFFNILSRFVIPFLSRSSHLLISWLQSPSAVSLESRKKKSVTAFTLSPSICPEMMEPDAMILVFFDIVISLFFHSPPSPSSRGSLVSLHFPPLEIHVEVRFGYHKECEILLAFNRQGSEMLTSSNVWDSSK